MHTHRELITHSSDETIERSQSSAGVSLALSEANVPAFLSSTGSEAVSAT